MQSVISDQLVKALNSGSLYLCTIDALTDNTKIVKTNYSSFKTRMTSGREKQCYSRMLHNTVTTVIYVQHTLRTYYYFNKRNKIVSELGGENTK